MPTNLWNTALNALIFFQEPINMIPFMAWGYCLGIFLNEVWLTFLDTWQKKTWFFSKGTGASMGHSFCDSGPIGLTLYRPFEGSAQKAAGKVGVKILGAPIPNYTARDSQSVFFGKIYQHLGLNVTHLYGDLTYNGFCRQNGLATKAQNQDFSDQNPGHCPKGKRI